jgi:hypothetical protein
MQQPNSFACLEDHSHSSSSFPCYVHRAHSFASHILREACILKGDKTNLMRKLIHNIMQTQTERLVDPSHLQAQRKLSKVKLALPVRFV